MAAEPEAFLVPPPPSSSSPVPGEHGGDGITSPAPETPRPRNGFRSTGGGKRRSSCGAKQPAWKRRRRAGSECGPVLPSEFLLGGNIFDPLNLNSLLDEEVSRALNARTPQSSPLPARGRDPVEILVPRDITDPLSLNVPGEGLRLASPAKSSRRRHRHRGQQRNSNKHDGGGEKSDGNGNKSSGNGDKNNSGGNKSNPNGNKTTKSNANVSRSGVNVNRSNANANKTNDGGTKTNAGVKSNANKPNPNADKTDGSGDKSKSDVKSDSGLNDDGDAKGVNAQRHRKRRRTCSKSEGAASKSTGKPPRRQTQKFQYGNYCKYYGYRNPDCEDGRLRAMKGEWFEGKEVLDVGCNVGHVTLSIAKRWGPARVVGLDIDGGLIRSARQNIRHYLSEEMGGKEKGFPAALAASRGPIAAPRLPPDGPGAKEFPNNVVFVTVSVF
ncbi:7SK snRNA methylphosphate capping enzyme [Patagioenas fasciata monilis]|uniref:RNA methyltransferase n=1 Tax=Patagioenas fasciata monilis TaxID=372326 RepID=A0A1V4KEW4_PATFA|nr:7SK snRNA methylphosphate capping enzyme [Patagioenas fasciata monilis]